MFLNAEYATAWLTDVNPDLINLYRALQSESHAFVTSARALCTPEHNRAYAYRARFNRLATPGSAPCGFSI